MKKLRNKILEKMGCYNCQNGRRTGILCVYFWIGCLCIFLSVVGIAMIILASTMHLDALFLIFCLFMIPGSVLTLVLGIYYSFGAACHPDSIYNSESESEEEENLRSEREPLAQMV